MENSIPTVFEREYYLRTADFDCRGRLHPAAVLDLFQDVAGCHAKVLGCGYDVLAKLNLMWVLVRVKFEILNELKMFDKVKVRTWPLEPSRTGFRREYIIFGSNGEPAVKGCSDWVTINSETRRFVSAKDIYPIKEGFCTELAIDGKVSRLRDFEGAQKTYHLIPRFSDIDINGHVNNVKYANFVLDAVPLGDKDRLRDCQIEYRRELLADSPIDVMTLKSESEIFAKGANSEGEIMFICKMAFK